MLASHRWLSELTGLSWPADEMARRFTSVGLEVESVSPKGASLDRVVIAEVRAKAPHPSKSGLTLVTVFDGAEEKVIVCGASNVPEPGARVILAQLGATLPNGIAIAPRKLGGIDSPGMLCGETELGIGSDDSGLFLVPAEIAAAPGTPIVDALGLTDHVLEIGLTPNRPDCLGHRGLARELCAIAGIPFAPKDEPTPFTSVSPDDAAVRIEDVARCPRYGAARISGVTVAPSPFALRYRLHVLGLRAISNLVDATNLVMLEWGHPIHAFDVAKLRGGASIVVRSANAGETMKTLDGVERKFESDDLLIYDSEGPVAIAGVMGGENSGIADTTSEVLIECAYFAPRSVRRTSRRLGMHTDASHRFERGVDPNAVPAVLASAARLLGALGGGTIATTAIDRHPAPIAPQRVELRWARARALLGYDVPREVALQALRGVGVVVLGETPDAVSCELPTGRPDLTREVDLVEEIARLYGYDRIPTALARVRPSAEGTARPITFARSLKQAANATGLHEAICYGFVAPEDHVTYRVPTDAVRLQNPLSVERSVMRTSLLPGLATAAARALRHGAREIRLFEVGSSFHPRAGEVLPDERPTLALLLLGSHEAWFGHPRALDFFDAKGHVEGIVHAICGQTVTVVADDGLEATAPYLHPRRRGRILLGDHVVGHLGEIHPDLVDAADLGGRAQYAELDCVALLRAVDSVGARLASGLPRFPAVSRDVALLVDEAHAVAELRAVIAHGGGTLVEAVELFDEYRGEHIPAGKRSLAFRVTYRDPDATLTDARVDAAHTAAITAVTSRFEAERR